MDAVLELADLAAEQWGLVTAAQARALGVSNQTAARLTERGTLERLAYGVYRVTGAPAGPLDELRAAWLAIEPARRAAERVQDEVPVVVSHRAAAAAVYGYGDLDGDTYEFTTPRRRQSRRPDVRFHRADMDPGDWVVLDGLPVTTPERTIVDLAATRIDGGHLAGLVRDAITGYAVDEDELAARLRPYAHHYGAPLGDGSRMIEALLDQAGIPASPQVTSAAVRAALASGMTSGIADTTGIAAAFALANSPAMESISRALAHANSPAMESLQRVIAHANAPALESIRRMIAQINAPAMEAARKAMMAAVPKVTLPEGSVPKVTVPKELMPKIPPIDVGMYAALAQLAAAAGNTDAEADTETDTETNAGLAPETEPRTDETEDGPE